jgi:cytochrome c oxidase assembly factor CtaG
MDALIAIIVMAGIFWIVWHLTIWPLYNAFRNGEWGWIVALLLFGWIAGLFYRSNLNQQERQGNV